MDRIHATGSCVLAFCALSQPFLHGAGGEPAESQRNVVLIGWDGCQRDHLKEMIARNEVPHLLSVAAAGTLVDIDVTHGATDTKAGWAQILTGYAPAKSGVFSNRRYRPIPPGCSIFERLETFFGPTNIDTVALIGKKGHVDAEAPRRIPYGKWLKQEKRQSRIDQARPGRGNLQGGSILEEGGRKYVDVPGKPWFHAARGMDLFENGLKTNRTVARRAIEELEIRKDHRFFLFVHFAEPDHAGHAFGENAQEYTDAIRSNDEWTGRILAKLQELGLDGRTLVYITADHGFDEGGLGHRDAPQVFLATNDAQVNRNGNRMDIAPTILKRFGVEWAHLEPALDGIPLDVAAPVRKAPPAAAAAKRGKRPAPPVTD